MSRSYYEIAGVVMDGTFGYDHRRFSRLRRAIQQNKPIVVGDILTNLVLDFAAEHGEVQLEFERSEQLQWLERQGKKWRRRAKRIVGPLPIPIEAKVAIAALPEFAIAYSRATGSYDMRTPEVQRYEESVHWGGSGGRTI